MNNFLVAIAGFICAVLLVAIFAPFFIDWNSYKTQIEAFGSQVTGQNVQIVGDVELRILPQPVFHTGGLIITNAENEKILETNDFILELDFPSLLRGKVEVTSMHLNDGKIFVANTNNASLNLFNFGGNIGQPIGLDDISIKKLMLNNMQVEFSSDGNQSTKSLSINQAELTARSLIGPFKLKGQLNVVANDNLYQRDFSVSVGKFAAEKPLSVKVQVSGEQKGSRLSFLGNLVGLEAQPLLTGQLTLKGMKGENLIGFGQNADSKLSDDVEVLSDLTLDYSAVNFANLRINMGAKDADSLTQSLKISGDLKYIWGRSPSLDGALNIGVADFDYLKNQFLSQNQLDADQPIYQSMQQLVSIAKNWLGQHVVIGAAQDADDETGLPKFSSNISLNIEQLNFLQNGITDRVRLITSLINIENDQISLPQFSGNFPGNAKLSYVLSRQSVGQSEDRLMTGQYEFTALHLRKLTNWLLFKNQKIENISDFWGINGRMTSKGNVDILLDSINISSPSVKTRQYEFALDYAFKNQTHDLEIGLARISFDNGDLSAFQNYIAGFAQTAFVAPNDGAISDEKYHLFPSQVIENIGDVRIKIHSDESFYGIRDIGVFDARVMFSQDNAALEEFSLVGDKIYITATGGLLQKYRDVSVVNVEKSKPLLEFSIIDSDMNVTPQLVHNLLFDNNLFLDKIIPNKGALSVVGKLLAGEDNENLYLDITGKVGSSELDIGAEIAIENGQFVQKDLQYQLANAEAILLLQQYGLADLLKLSSFAEGDLPDEDAVVRLIISQNPENLQQKNVKLVVIADDQTIDLTAQSSIDEALNLSGDLHLDLNGLGIVAQQLGLFDGDFNRLKDAALFDAKIEIADGLTHISSDNMHIFNSDFSAFNLDINGDKKLSFAAKAEQFEIANLLSFLSGENKNILNSEVILLDDAAQQTISEAQGIFGEDAPQLPAGFGLRMLQNVDFEGKIIVQQLKLSDSFILNDAEVSIRSNLAENNIFVEYSGEFFNTNLVGGFVLKPTDNQLYMDVTLQAYGLNVEAASKGLGFENQYITGLVDVELDITGQGYSVEGLLSNLAGTIDVDLKGLTTNRIDSDYFNREISEATDEQKIDEIFSNFIIRNALVEGINNIKILPEKLSIQVQNGLASIGKELTFQKPNVKAQKALLSGQFDLTSNSSRFALQIPLSNDEKIPKLMLEWLSVDGGNSEDINFENLKEYYKVKLLEKNVQRLEQLQIEIKRKNDAEIARYQQEKFEALAFKNEIRVRVEKAIDGRKMREMVAKKPPVPSFMPFVFVRGTQNLDDASGQVTNNDLTPNNIVELVSIDLEARLAALRAIEAAEKAAAAEIERLEAEAAAQAEKLALEALAEIEKAAADAAEAAQLLDLEFPGLEYIEGSDDLLNVDDDFIAEGGGFDTGNLSADESQLLPSGEVEIVEIAPLPN